jgi:hypothetical protein
MSDNHGLYGNLTDEQRQRAAAFEISAKRTADVAEHLRHESTYVEAKEGAPGGLKAAFFQILEGKKPEGIVESNGYAMNTYESTTMRIAQWISDGHDPDDIDTEIVYEEGQ